jgi:hypothetical protein
MKHLGSFIILILLAACVALQPRPDAGRQAPPAGELDTAQPAELDNVGRTGPDGAPPVADRGIGGTGSPVAMAPAIRSADRGIGGTGIVGVVTGFGSIFVNGVEVEYDDTASIDIDGTAASASALRAGQMVAIQAEGPAFSPHAKAISVRTAVAGRIEALELGTGMLTIAGQAVSVPDGTWGANGFGLGDWVKVSGVRRGDGAIVASRLDAAPTGVLQARGRVVRDGDVVRVGKLELSGSAADSVKDGQFVVLTGDYEAGHGHVSTVASDTLWPNPAAYFGPSISQLIVQAFVRVDKDSVSINGVKVRSGSIVSSQAHGDGIAVVSLQRQPDGSLTAVGLRYGDLRGHTDGPNRGGRGSGTGDSAQAPQRNGHNAAVPPPQPTPNDNGATAGGAVTIAAVAADPFPLKSVTQTTVTSSPQTQSSPPVPQIQPSSPPVPQIQPSSSVPQTQPSSPPQTPSPPIQSSPILVLAPDPPLTIAAPPKPPAPPLLPGTTPQGTPSGSPVLQSVSPTSALTSQLISSNTGTSALLWDRAKLPAVLSKHGARAAGGFSVTNPTSAPTISVLTAAMTSVTTTVGRPATPVATTPVVSAVASPTAVSSGLTTIGTTSAKQSATSRGRTGAR